MNDMDMGIDTSTRNNNTFPAGRSIVLETTGLTRLYKQNRGADAINMTVYEGEIYGILGPNGSGKTTFMKMLTGLIQPQKGEAKIFGFDIKNDLENALCSVGSIIETPTCTAYMSAAKNLEMAARYYRNPKDIMETLDKVNLKAYKDEKVERFSLGMKQRMGIALAMIGSPKFLILDEPSNGLDIEGTVEIRNIILDLVKEEKCTVLVAGHIAAEMQKLCTRIGVMQSSHHIATAEMAFILDNYPSLEDYFIETVQADRKAVAQ